ncbi:hypothetical protein NCS57_00456100 [Fusarium keratoplasticum]|uniref:Uncharacterized protein n=1 Tax=Fusarium keratoplasticum TaxID=1328300 RepID=A0ACC0R741_9HYPO|nr:hypothetical protein NCS57_00456100 [Fusarium keratoplasticum]KAI8675547.1 hypothetical protein NCS57_00456100 [Fusarium keratoplasticum]
MPNHRDLAALPRASFAEGRLAFLGDIPLDAEKQEIAAFVNNQGFKSVTLYWACEKRLEPTGWKHEGYCIAEFLSRNDAQEATNKLPDAVFKDRHLKTAVPQLRKQPSSDPVVPTPPPEAKAISSEAKAISPEVKAVTSAQGAEPRLVNPPTSNPPPAQQPLVKTITIGRGSAIATSTGSGHTNKADPAKIRQALQNLKYPDAYSYSDSWGRDDIEGAVMARMKQREKELNSSGSLLGRDGDRDRVRSQAVPSPSPGDKKHCSSTWIYVTKVESDERKAQRITLPELPLYLANGWQEWFKCQKPVEEGTDKDERKILMVEDVNTVDNPKNDTLKLFDIGTAISQKADGITWTPGRVLGATDGTEEAPMSTSKTFIPPDASGADMSSATSRGHHQKYTRPSKVGAGWGDYDRFREWQLHGRRVEVDWVDKKRWDPENGNEIQFRLLGKDGETQGDRVTADSDGFRPTLSESTTLPESLYEKLTKAKASRDNHRAGRGGVGRGGVGRGGVGRGGVGRGGAARGGAARGGAVRSQW